MTDETIRIVQRIPWLTPYGYTEVSYEYGGVIDYAALQSEAAAMEQAYLALHPAMRSPLARAAVQNGAQEIPDLPDEDGYEREPVSDEPPPRRPAARAPVRRPAQRQQGRQQHGGGVPCERCGGVTREGKVRQTQRGPRRPYDCMEGCEGDRQRDDGTYYPYTTWVNA